ncbi:MAG: hypothetical protein VYD64_02865 [Pseudomonadota bacterium]|nr:hypothetical protein [Pseudomonadota bacterium]
MVPKEQQAWLFEFYQASGVHDTFVHAISNLRASLPDLHSRLAGTRLEDLEAAFDSRFGIQEVFDRFLREAASNLIIRLHENFLPVTTRFTSAAELLFEVHRPFNEATRNGDYGPAVEAFLAAEQSDGETAFIYRTLSWNYQLFNSLITMIAYPAITYDLAVTEALKQARSDGDGPSAYEFGPGVIGVIKELNALASGFLYSGLHDRPERDTLKLATFLSSDDGSRWSYQSDFAMERVISEPLVEMLVPFVKG